MYDGAGLSVSNAVLTTPGWRIYFVDLATLGLLTGTEPWNGTKRALRLHPTQPKRRRRADSFKSIGCGW